MMRKITMMAFAAVVCGKASAGGLMTNTNYHIAFDRMMARGASFDIDAAYSNPAGLSWGHDGLQFSLDFQKPWQNRDITVSTEQAPFNNYKEFNMKYEGKASAPIVPALFAAYKKDKFNVSYMLGIVGSGGSVKYDNGVPMFTIPVVGMLSQSQFDPVTMEQSSRMKYQLDTKLEGKQYIFGSQINFGYQFTENFAAAVGIRANYYDGSYKGNVTAISIANNMMPATNLLDLQLDCKQKGWGFAPIISLDYHKGPLTLAAKYEFRTKLETENDTKTLSIGSMGKVTDVNALSKQVGNEATMAALSQTSMGAMAGKIGGYLDGVKTRYDMPALFTFAVGYDFSEKLRGTLEYHFFDDKNAKMANDRQETLNRGTFEYQAGVEYDINEKFTVSLGAQRTDYGLSDDYQQNTSFACDSWSVGFGGAVNLNEHIRINAGYFITLYEDYKKNTQYLPSINTTETYSRTNNVIGIGIDYKF